MKNKAKFLSEKISGAQNIAIIIHHNPDGDALGSALGLCELIRGNFRKSPIILHTGIIPEFISFLPHRFDWVKKSEEMGTDYIPDFAIMVDTSGENTGNESMAIFNRAKDTAKIDHHQFSPDIAIINIHKLVNSAAQIILEIAQSENWKISITAANCLYAGIASDTGGFKWIDTPDAFISAAECMRFGANPRYIDEQLRIIKKDNVIANAKIVVNTEFMFDDRLAISCVPLNEYKKLGSKGEFAMENLRLIDTVNYVALLKEQEKGIIHVSMRSKNAAVHEIAKSLGGGGHVNAAAVSLKMSLKDAKQLILKKFEEILVPIK